MAETSAGLLLYRRGTPGIELFLVHPGGPFWRNKDLGAWSIPKGLYGADEAPLAAAQREFTEETGFVAAGPFIELGVFKQPSGKRIAAWGVEADCDAAAVKSNLFTLEWPPRSGQMQEFAEVDRAGWFAPDEAYRKILTGQRPILDRLLALPR